MTERLDVLGRKCALPTSDIDLVNLERTSSSDYCKGPTQGHSNAGTTPRQEHNGRYPAEGASPLDALSGAARFKDVVAIDGVLGPRRTS